MEKIYGKLIGAVMSGAKKATKYISPVLVVKATHQGKRNNRATRRTIIMTIGKPNYRERQFIKACQKAKEPFPVKKIQLTHEAGK